MIFDLNINNYNVPELIDILNINEEEFQKNMYNKAWMVQSMNEYINNLYDLDNANRNNQDIIKFIHQAFNKIYEYNNQKTDNRDNTNNISFSQIQAHTQTQIFNSPHIITQSIPQQDINMQQNISSLMNKKSKFQENEDLFKKEQREKILNDNNIQHIIQEEEQIVNYFPKRYRKGTLNPINKQVNKYVLNINSRFRKNYINTISTDFLMELPNPLKNVISMKIENIEFTNLHYNFSNQLGTDEFSIDIYDDISGVITNEKRYTIKIENGNYNAIQLQNYLNNNVFNSFVDSSLSIIQCYYNDITNKFKFILDPSYSLLHPNTKFNLDFRINSDKQRNIQLNLGWMMGYRKPYYVFSDDYITISNSSVLNVEGFNPEAGFTNNSTNYIFIHINDFNNNKAVVIDTPYQQGLITSMELMGKVSITNTTNLLTNSYTTNQLFFNNIFKRREYYGPVDIQKLEIKLLDEFGRVIDLQKNDYSFSLEVEMLYDL
jgi:hypothetical protein